MFILLILEITLYFHHANRIDPDQTSRSVASDLGLHWLSTFHLWDASHIWVTLSTLG